MKIDQLINKEIQEGSGKPAWASDQQIKDMQNWMLDALITPDQISQQDINQVFIDSANLQAEQCLAIYQRGYILRLSKCLAEQFPALCHALGEKLFEQFARQFLVSYPSVSYTLYDLGRRFSAYLEEVRPDKNLPQSQKEDWIDFMVDLSRYEWLHFSLFDAQGHEGKPWPELDSTDQQLVLQPCFELGTYRYPVAWYYHEFKNNPELEFPPCETSYVAILRKDFKVSTFPINKIHYLFLQHLKSSLDIKQSLAHVAEMTGTPLEQVFASWQKEVREPWINAGFFIQRE